MTQLATTLAESNMGQSVLVLAAGLLLIAITVLVMKLLEWSRRATVDKEIAAARAAAESEAQSLGGHLVTIGDQAEQEWVHETFQRFGQFQHAGARSRVGPCGRVGHERVGPEVLQQLCGLENHGGVSLCGSHAMRARRNEVGLEQDTVAAFDESLDPA